MTHPRESSPAYAVARKAILLVLALVLVLEFPSFRGGGGGRGRKQGRGESSVTTAPQTRFIRPDVMGSHVFTTHKCWHLVGVFHSNGRYTVCPGRRNGVNGEALQKALARIYDQHNLHDWVDRRSLHAKGRPIPKIVCSEALV